MRRATELTAAPYNNRNLKFEDDNDDDEMVAYIDDEYIEPFFRLTHIEAMTTMMAPARLAALGRRSCRAREQQACMRFPAATMATCNSKLGVLLHKGLPLYRLMDKDLLPLRHQLRVIGAALRKARPVTRNC